MEQLPVTKTCTKCKLDLPLERYSKHPKARYGRQPACKDCATKYGKRYYAMNKEKWAEKEAQMRAENPEMLKKKNRDAATRFRSTPENRAKIKQNYEFTGRDRAWANGLEKRYGCTLAMYEQMFEDQGGLCKICRKEPDSKYGRLCVDHNHQTGALRGLLCHLCNHGIGQFKDNPVFLAAAIAYFQEYLDTQWDNAPEVEEDLVQ